MAQQVIAKNRDARWRFQQAFLSAPPNSLIGSDWDLAGLMLRAKANAPTFVSAFVKACDELRSTCRVPGKNDINDAVYGSGFQIDRHSVVIRNSRLLTDDANPALSKDLKAFLCHSSDDRPRVAGLHARLQAHGYKPWRDATNLLPGQNWSAEIRNALTKSDAVVVCLSNGSVTKDGFVQEEIALALDAGEKQPSDRIFLIPVMLEPVELPKMLSDLHAVNVSRDEGFHSLLSALRARSSQT